MVRKTLAHPPNSTPRTTLSSRGPPARMSEGSARPEHSQALTKRAIVVLGDLKYGYSFLVLSFQIAN